MKEITKALAAKQGQIKKLQRDIDALMRAAGILAGGEVKAKAKTKAKAAQPKAKRTRKTKTMSAAARKAVSKRMKAYWAKRRKAKG
ncbi:MAG: hypothetical protein MK365_00965 [Vicinamibacterales bacterium]|nr:hypothetical protein [Vicinamibacterales bacterium]